MKRRGMSAIAALAVVAAALASTAGAGSSAAAKTQAISCKSTLKIGFATPLTGGAAFLGQEQLSWAKYAVKTLQKQYGLKIKLITGDTPVEQGPAVARPSRRSSSPTSLLVALLGPATSGAAAGTSQAFFAAGIAHISPSATRTSLTKGDGQGRRRNGVLPGRAGRRHPGPDRRALHGQQAEGEEGRAVRLPGAVLAGLRRPVEAVLKAKGVSTSRISVSNTHDRLLVVRDQGPERH